jgi:nitroreductase
LDDAKRLLGIPDELYLLAILPLGYPATAVGRGKKERKPLAEVASRERYGQPFQ